MSRTPGAVNSGFRWDPELEEFQKRCASCAAKGRASFWPLTLEFWRPAWGLTRCRTCVLEARAKRNRERWLADPEWRRAKLEANREQRLATKRFAYAERWARLRADPVKYADYIERRRKQQREASRRHRERQKVAA